MVSVLYVKYVTQRIRLTIIIGYQDWIPELREKIFTLILFSHKLLKSVIISF